MNQKTYKAKILLFGEYTVILGSDALAMPTALFSGSWDYDAELSEQQHTILSEFHQYLNRLDIESVVFQSERFLADLDRHLIFRSNIPIGYGVGSSGAVTAAVFDQYYQKDPALKLPQVRNILGKMESFFHGSSSGLDPLICYLDQAVLIRGDQAQQQIIPANSGSYRLFLINTKKERRTGPLVNLFLNKVKTTPGFKAIIEQQLIPANNTAVHHFLQSDFDSLYENFNLISQLQWDYFQEMIPEPQKSLWKEGLYADLFKVKLCGAGGGGFLMGMTADWELFKNDKIHDSTQEEYIPFF